MRWLLICVLIFNASCIHLNSTENQSLNLENTKHLFQTTAATGALRVENLIYIESKYPLENFLKKLLSGDFSEALKKIDFNYKPSNADNKIISELLKEGLVPVYVNIENTGDGPISISEKNFYLTDDVTAVQALNSDVVPKDFKRFNSKAAVANAYNISVVVVATVVALAVIGIIFQGSSVPNLGSGWGSGPKYTPRGQSAKSNNSVLNDTQKTTRIDYRNYLLRMQILEPHKSVQGLLFFRFKPGSTNLSLKYQ